MHAMLDSAWGEIVIKTSSSISKVIKTNNILFFHNLYKLTVPKLILKQFGTNIIIL
jgi:hypothetical protein